MDRAWLPEGNKPDFGSEWVYILDVSDRKANEVDMVSSKCVRPSELMTFWHSTVPLALRPARVTDF
jgi:hypothetical protein